MELGDRARRAGFAWRHARRAGRARRARGADVPAQPGRAGHELPADDDLRRACRRCGTQPDARARLAAAHHRDRRTTRASCRRGEKRGITIGMGMTEKQGGSDVRANTTRATPVGARPGSCTSSSATSGSSRRRCATRSSCSRRPTGGLSCFLLPRFTPDGARNAIRIQRLKDKLGDWSNASSEVEFAGRAARGWSARRAAASRRSSRWWRSRGWTACSARRRSCGRRWCRRCITRGTARAFGKLLVDQPLMRNVLADLALEIGGGDRARDARGARRRCARRAIRARSGVRAHRHGDRQVLGVQARPPFVNEAQECLGGTGYVEESILPRLYRQAPLNSIWEGSGNIQCLDVLRALRKEPASARRVLRRAAMRRAAAARCSTARRPRCGRRSPTIAPTLEARSRRLVERMAIALQAACWCAAATSRSPTRSAESRLGARARRGVRHAGRRVRRCEALIERALPG